MALRYLSHFLVRTPVSDTKERRHKVLSVGNAISRVHTDEDEGADKRVLRKFASLLDAMPALPVVFLRLVDFDLSCSLRERFILGPDL